MDKLRKIGKVILWVLFWYYLIPYYLLKKYAFHNIRRPVLWSSLGSIFMVFVVFGRLVSASPDDSESTSKSEAPKVHYVVKKVGKKRLNKALAKQKLLNKEEKKKEAEYEKLQTELNRNKEKAKKAKLAQERAKARQEKEAKKAAEQQRRAESNRTSSTQQHSHHITGNPAGNHGDMNTADTGKIVGNSNSHIYHVPGQAGYRMNSANAVYFNSEAEAKAAGYRKALR